MTAYTRWFGDVRVGDRDAVGGKCASLGELVAAGVAVPDGFAVTVAAFDAVRAAGGVGEALDRLEAACDPGSPAGLAEVRRRAAELLGAAPLPDGLADGVRDGYAELCRRAGRDDVPVAVRSSAVAEDGAAASFAGQQETYLWVRGSDEVLRRVRDCWASLYTPQAVAYRSALGEGERREASRIAVGVQEMVDARVAGVAFTVSPVTGDPSVVAVNASGGLGEAVVSGVVTPDEYWVSKIGPVPLRATIGHKALRCVPAATGTGTTLVDVPADLVDVPCLDDALLVELAAIAVLVERHYGAPQDIEWALADDGAGGHRFLLLQSRPETVHAARPVGRRAAAPPAAASYLSVLRTLAARPRPEAS
jgi:pyruvate,water dikinase